MASNQQRENLSTLNLINDKIDFLMQNQSYHRNSDSDSKITPVDLTTTQAFCNPVFCQLPEPEEFYIGLPANVLNKWSNVEPEADEEQEQEQEQGAEEYEQEKEQEREQENLEEYKEGSANTDEAQTEVADGTD